MAGVGSFRSLALCPCVEKFLNLVVVVGLVHDDSGVPFVGLENVDGCVGAQLLDGCSFSLGGVGFGRCSCGQGLSDKEADVVGCFFSQEAETWFNLLYDFCGWDFLGSNGEVETQP